jgi:hypothetical protein
MMNNPVIDIPKEVVTCDCLPDCLLGDRTGQAGGGLVISPPCLPTAILLLRCSRSNLQCYLLTYYYFFDKQAFFF